jgi:heterodisulfide reductase subunit B
MNVAYFPGCSLHAMSREYDQSTRLVCESLGVRLTEVDDWNCCGATAGHSLDHELTMDLNTRNLLQVGRMNLDSVMTPCPGCFNRLKSTNIKLRTSEGTVGKEDESTKGSPGGLPRVMNLLQFLMEEIGLNGIAKPTKIPLKGLKLAAYYGCLTTRPRKIAEFDDSEQPVSMDRILDVLGAETVSWSHKTECCGGPFAASEVSIVVDLGGQVLEAARYAGAEAIVVACPMCQLNLDSRQGVAKDDQAFAAPLPIIYFTQLIALAYGFSVSRSGFKRLLVDPLSLLKRKGLA